MRPVPVGDDWSGRVYLVLEKACRRLEADDLEGAAQLLARHLKSDPDMEPLLREVAPLMLIAYWPRLRRSGALKSFSEWDRGNPGWVDLIKFGLSDPAEFMEQAEALLTELARS